MDSVFGNLGDTIDDKPGKIALDELYVQKQERDIKEVKSYNLVLARIHNRIKLTARQRKDEQFCWFTVPEIMVGMPYYNNSSCIAYVMDQLTDNGFRVAYTHPNCLMISWAHWIPSYVRNEIKNKRGIEIDGQGNEIKKKNAVTFKDNQPASASTSKTQYKDTKSYNPTGNLIYGADLFKSIHQKTK